MSAPSASSTAITDAATTAAELHRSLSRDFNLLSDLSNRSNRKAGMTRINEVLQPILREALGRVEPVKPVVKPKLIFSAKAAAEAAKAAPPPAAVTAADSDSSKPATPIPMTPQRRAAIDTLLRVLTTPITSSTTLLTLIDVRIGDELESVRSAVLDFTLDAMTAVAQYSETSMLMSLLNTVTARLAPSPGAMAMLSSSSSSVPMDLSSSSSNNISSLSVAASSVSLPSFATPSITMLPPPGGGSLVTPSSSIAAPSAVAGMVGGIALPSVSSVSLPSLGSGLSSILSASSNTSHGSAAVAEGAEELRLKLLKLLGVLIDAEIAKSSSSSAAPSSSASPLVSSLDKLVSILLRTVSDAYPELKKESCTIITTLTRTASQVFSSRSLTWQARNDAISALTKGLLPSIKHQHSQVRVQALQALGAVIKAGVQRSDGAAATGASSLSNSTLESLPILATLVSDRTPRVREVLISELCSILVSYGSQLNSQDQTKLLFLLLQCMIDEVDTVAVKAVVELDQAAKEIEKEGKMEDTEPAGVVTTTQASSDATLSSTWLPSSLASPFTSRPSSFIRSLIVSRLSDLLALILADLSDWTSTKRARAAGALKALLVYAEGDIAIHLATSVLPALAKSIRDESSSVHISLTASTEIIGHFVTDPNIWCEWLVKEVERNADAGYRTSLLSVLAGCVKGMPVVMNASATSISSNSPSTTPSSKLSPLFPSLLSTLSSSDLSCSDDFGIRLQLHRILNCLLTRMPNDCAKKDNANKIWHMICQLDTKSGGGGVEAAAATTGSGGINVAQEEEKQLLGAMEALARCEKQYGEQKMSDSSTTASPTSLLSTVYCSHFLTELTTLFGADLVQTPSLAESLLPEGWGQKPASDNSTVHFTMLTFFQLLERALTFVAMESQTNSGVGEVSALLQSHLPSLLHILVVSSRPSNDSIARSLTLNWLYKLILLNSQSKIISPQPQEKSESYEILKTMIVSIILPNCQWHSGRVAASIRLHALTLLHAMCTTQQGTLLTSSLALSVTQAIFPIFQSNLDDDEPRVRILVVTLLQVWLSVIPAHTLSINPDNLTEFHRSLLKRLDDSHDDIRLEVIRAFSLLFHRVFPRASEYDPTDSYYRYILSTFFIYLDDSNPKVIQACFEFIRSSMGYNPKVFLQETETAKKKQTQGGWYDQLLEEAQKYSAALKEISASSTSSSS